jgi:hypothetical protein
MHENKMSLNILLLHSEYHPCNKFETSNISFSIAPNANLPEAAFLNPNSCLIHFDVSVNNLNQN